MDPDRKTLIADAAIALLGTVGARGLTHRAVDVQAGLPEGSTSFYCRTKLALWRLALDRHAALDAADLAEDAQRMAAARWSRKALVELLVRRVEDWASPPKRERLVARFELFLTASREPELAALVEAQRERFRQGAEEALRRAGVANAARVAAMVIVAVDGLLLERARGQVGPQADAAGARRLLEAVLPA